MQRISSFNQSQPRPARPFIWKHAHTPASVEFAGALKKPSRAVLNLASVVVAAASALSMPFITKKENVASGKLEEILAPIDQAKVQLFIERAQAFQELNPGMLPYDSPAVKERSRATLANTLVNVFKDTVPALSVVKDTPTDKISFRTATQPIPPENLERLSAYNLDLMDKFYERVRDARQPEDFVQKLAEFAQVVSPELFQLPGQRTAIQEYATDIVGTIKNLREEQQKQMNLFLLTLLGAISGAFGAMLTVPPKPKKEEDAVED